MKKMKYISPEFEIDKFSTIDTILTGPSANTGGWEDTGNDSSVVIPNILG